MSNPPTPVTKKAVISIPTAAIGAIAKWAGTDETRTHLHQVLFTKDVVVAVDGHRMVIAPCETYGQTIGINRQHLLTAVTVRKAIPIEGPSVITIEDHDKGYARIGFGSSSMYIVVKKADHTQFPPYEVVIPKHNPKAEHPNGYAFDPRYLADIAEVNAATCDGRDGVRVVAWGNKTDAMLFENAAGVRFVVMPIRQ